MIALKKIRKNDYGNDSVTQTFKWVKYGQMMSDLFSLRWNINTVVAHECRRGHLKLVSARKRIGRGLLPPRGDRTRHAAARRRRSESHPFTHYHIMDTPCEFYIFYSFSYRLNNKIFLHYILHTVQLYKFKYFLH